MGHSIRIQVEGCLSFQGEATVTHIDFVLWVAFWMWAGCKAGNSLDRFRDASVREASGPVVLLAWMVAIIGGIFLWRAA